jgi:hypothetical protein
MLQDLQFRIHAGLMTVTAHRAPGTLRERTSAVTSEHPYISATAT